MLPSLDAGPSGARSERVIARLEAQLGAVSQAEAPAGDPWPAGGLRYPKRTL
jgi:hypothetical protein